MALVNAFQNSSHDTFSHDQQAGELTGRFIKIRSVWPFPVSGKRQADSTDSELHLEDVGDAVAPSSFVT